VNWFVIPSLPSYEINNLHEVRSTRMKRPIKQKDGIVKLYNKSRHTYTSRSTESLYREATKNNQGISIPSTLPGEYPLQKIASNLLNTILEYYKTSMENLTHKERIRLLKVLMSFKGT